MRHALRPGWFAACCVALAVSAVLLLVVRADDPAPPSDFGGSRPAAADTKPGPEAKAEPAAKAEAGPSAERDGSRGSRAGDGAKPSPTGEAAPTAPAAPVGLRMERVGVDADVVPVGVEPDGSAEVPPDPGQAGWYRFGAAPGDASGSAVLVGHVDSETGELGALAALYDVRKGDVLTVRRASGAPVDYRVSTRRTVDKDELPDDVFRRDGPPVLTLITCAAPYDRDRGGYQRNVIVTAVPTESG